LQLAKLGGSFGCHSKEDTPMLAIDFTDYVKVRQWFDDGQPSILVELVEATGSTPRESGTAMAVNASEIAGTIGGGQLEFMAMAEARSMLRDGVRTRTTAIPLGPEIGQCCGGRVELKLRQVTGEVIEEIRQSAEEARARQREVFVFGAGHTGRALASMMAPLPFRLHLIDPRPETLGGLDDRINVIATALPESVVAQARPSAAFVTMTHEHSLDFLITAEALKRGDAAYCGMIGSATKRQVFVNWLEKNGYAKALASSLVCPIGASPVRDKRPEIIAALTSAEIVKSLSRVYSDSME
jgi:xanthine dehydrogenase accessory factor